MRIQPAKRLKGKLRVPGDKSISHRAAIMAALATGRTRIENFSTSEDCAATLRCLEQLGVHIRRAGTTVEIEGVGAAGLSAPASSLDCGNSGSTMRMLAGVLASQNFVSELTGDESLSNRPMERIIEPLTMMGARIESTDGRAPLRITGHSPLNSISYTMPVVSAQVKACIMLAGLNAKGRTEIFELLNWTRDHTERMFRWFGVKVKSQSVLQNGIRLGLHGLSGPAKFKARDGIVPGDISSAAFFVTAAALLPSSKLKIEDVGLNPTRSSISTTLIEFGFDVFEIPNVVRFGTEDYNEPFGKIEVTGDKGPPPFLASRSNVLRGVTSSQLIDELPMIAVAGTRIPGGLSIRDAAELRVKETDRITATVTNLRAMGVQVEEHSDGMTINQCRSLHGAQLDSFGDHRIAMAFSIAALIADSESEIAGAECVRVSFPEFYDLLESVVVR